MRDVEHGTDINKDRRPQAKLTGTRSERNFQFGAAQIIGTPANGIIGLTAIGHWHNFVDRIAVSVKSRNGTGTHNPRPDTANIETANLWLAEEKAVGQPDVINTIARRLRTIFQRVNISTLSAGRKDEVTQDAPMLGSIQTPPNIFDTAAETGKIDAADYRLAAGRPNPVVPVIIDQ